MAPNTFKCNCLTPLHFKGLKSEEDNKVKELKWNFITTTIFVDTTDDF